MLYSAAEYSTIYAAPGLKRKREIGVAQHSRFEIKNADGWASIAIEQVYGQKNLFLQ